MRRQTPRAGAICKTCGKPPGFCICKRKPHSQQQVVGTPCEWIVTRTIRETYGAFGCTREEAVAWVNEKAPGADTVTILTEVARKVRPNED